MDNNHTKESSDLALPDDRKEENGLDNNQTEDQLDEEENTPRWICLDVTRATKNGKEIPVSTANLHSLFLRLRYVNGLEWDIDPDDIRKIFVDNAKGSVIIVEDLSKNKFYPEIKVYKLQIDEDLSGLSQKYKDLVVTDRAFNELIDAPQPISPRNYASKYCFGVSHTDQLVQTGLENILKTQEESLNGAKVAILGTSDVQDFIRWSEKEDQAIETFPGKEYKILDKDFVVIPLNPKPNRWCLLIVCYPDLDGMVSVETGEKIGFDNITTYYIDRYNSSTASSYREGGDSPVIDFSLRGLRSPRISCYEHAKQPCFVIIHKINDCHDEIFELVKLMKEYFSLRQKVEGKTNVDFNEIIVFTPSQNGTHELTKQDSEIYTILYFKAFLEYYKSDNFELGGPNCLEDEPTPEDMENFKKHLADLSKMSNTEQKENPIPLASAGVSESIPDREDDNTDELTAGPALKKSKSGETIDLSTP